MHLLDLSFDEAPVSLRFRAATDVDALLTEDTDPDRIPYWAVLWESACGLSRWAVARGGWIGRPVLELGCGAGLVGMVLAYLGARVTQTDLYPDAVLLAGENAARNGIPEMEQITADWRSWPLAGRWPLIVGSDITYERSSHPALLEVLERALAPGGSVYLSDPGRPMTLDFLARARGAGWTAAREEAPPAPGMPTTFVHTLRRRADGVIPSALRSPASPRAVRLPPR